MSEQVQIIGFDKLIYCLNHLPEKTSYRIVIQALKRAAKPILRTARQNVPKRTRNLMKSIQVFPSKSREFPAVWIGVRSGRRSKFDGWYGHFIHFGTKGFGKRNRSAGVTLGYAKGGGGIKATPFMTDALTQSGDAAIGEIHKSLQHVIVRFLQRNMPKA